MARMSLQEFIEGCPAGWQCVVTYRYERLPASQFLAGPADVTGLSYSTFAGEGSMGGWNWVPDGAGTSRLFGRLLALAARYVGPGEELPAACREYLARVGRRNL